MITTIWLVFLGFLFVLTIKLRKSPFDLSMSHHAHQEIVRGMTTEMSGKTLAKVEVMHWCENVLFMGWVGPVLRVGQPAFGGARHRGGAGRVLPGDMDRQQLRAREMAGAAQVGVGWSRWWRAA